MTTITLHQAGDRWALTHRDASRLVDSGVLVIVPPPDCGQWCRLTDTEADVLVDRARRAGVRIERSGTDG